MKKTILKFGLFLLAVLLPMGCSNDEEDETKETIIEKRNCGAELSKFLDEQLPLTSGGFPPFFYDSMTNTKKDILLINSKEEFSEIFPGFDIVLLNIDFSENTLIVGHKLYNSGIGDKHPKILNKQLLYKSGNGYTIELRCTCDIIISDLITIQYINFWGIYPKLQNLPFTIILKNE